MAKKRVDDSEGSWMDTYGDLVTLLLTFFVLLFSMSSISQQKFKLFIQSFGGSPPTVMVNPMVGADLVAFTKTSESRSKSDEGSRTAEKPADATDKEALEEIKEMTQTERELIEQVQEVIEQSPEYKQVQVEFDNLFEELKSYIKTEGLEDSLSLYRVGDKINIRIKDTLLFDSGSAEYKPGAETVLSALSDMLSVSLDAVEKVTVEGHTDNVPIKNSRFEDNWDLSAKRATNAVRILNETNDIPLDKLNAVAYGEYMPIETNDTAEGRAANRRVCFVIERKDVLRELIDNATQTE